jgi:HAMP domain-containing protein
LEKYKIGQNVRILFINKQGEILLDTYHQATNSHLPVVLWKAVQSDAFTKRPRRYHFFNQTFLIQTKAVDSHLYALVALPVSELEEPIKRPKIAVLLATLSALILYTTLVYGGLQRIVLQPLEELNRATQEIAQGNVKTEAKISSRDELKDLSNSIHQIGEKLASYTDAADNQTVSDTREGSTTGKTN